MLGSMWMNQTIIMARISFLCICTLCSCSGDGPLPDTSTNQQADINELPVQEEISVVKDIGLAQDTVSDQGSDTSSQLACNGAVEYCNRKYNHFVQACTHNAMSSVAYNFTLPTPNQQHSITKQLDDGVRCLMLDVYWVLNKLKLCHGVCGPWGQTPLDETLLEIRQWLDGNPRDTVTLILETYVTKQQFFNALVEAELASPDAKPDENFPLFFHKQIAGSPWPTLGTMLDSNQRLVILTDESVASTGWYLEWRSFGWETPFNDAKLDCSKGRGDAQTSPNGLFILNNFLTCDGGGCPSESIPLNAYDAVIQRSKACAQQNDDLNPGGQVPTFVNVDHYQVPANTGDPEISDMIEAIHTLNQNENWETLP
jgi:hypothetical protein